MRRSLPDSFEACQREEARHSARWSGKLANNTYLRRSDDGAFEIVLHRTAIVRFYPDGRTVVNTGGWNTTTTRERMRRCGVNVGTTAGVLTVRHGGSEWAFDRAVVLRPDGSVYGDVRPAAEAIAEARAAKRAEKRRIREMTRARIAAARL